MISYAPSPCFSHTVFFLPPVDWSTATPPFFRLPCQQHPFVALQDAFKRAKAVGQLLEYARFCLTCLVAAWWCADSLGRGIRTCIFRANGLYFSPYLCADLRT